MKTLLLCLLFISCTQPEVIKYVPKEVITNDTLSKLINNARVDKGLNALQSETLLIELCKKKAIEMEASKEINHNGFTSLEIKTDSFAQIVGYGYDDETSLFQAYLKSNEHNYIIYGNFTHIGCYTYKTYNCVLFAKF